MITELVPVTLLMPADKAPRSHGVHQSSIIRCIATETGILKAEYAEELSLVDASQANWWANLGPVNQIRISIGLAWEEWYIPQMLSVVDHPGEMQVDGIYMTHDGESLDTVMTQRGPRHLLCLHEVKTTYKSTKTVGNLETQWMWTAQTKGYCKGLNTLIAYIHVLFLCGDYKYPIQPQLKCWRVTYTQPEIDDHWDLMTNYVRHRRLMEREDAGLEGGV